MYPKLKFKWMVDLARCHGNGDSFSVVLLETSARVSLHPLAAKKHIYLKTGTNSQKLRCRKRKHKDSSCVYAKVAKVEDLQVLYLIRKGNMNLKGEMESVFLPLGPLEKLLEAALL